jgi:hypothetical protein
MLLRLNGSLNGSRHFNLLWPGFIVLQSSRDASIVTKDIIHAESHHRILFVKKAPLNRVRMSIARLPATCLPAPRTGSKTFAHLHSPDAFVGSLSRFVSAAALVSSSFEAQISLRTNFSEIAGFNNDLISDRAK